MYCMPRQNSYTIVLHPVPHPVPDDLLEVASEDEGGNPGSNLSWDNKTNKTTELLSQATSGIIAALNYINP